MDKLMSAAKRAIVQSLKVKKGRSSSSSPTARR